MKRLDCPCRKSIRLAGQRSGPFLRQIIILQKIVFSAIECERREAHERAVKL